jgi:hypothetical protein
MKPLIVRYSRQDPGTVKRPKTAVVRPPFLYSQAITRVALDIDAGKVDEVIIAGPVFEHGWRIFTDRPIKRVVEHTDNPIHAMEQAQALERIQQR